MSLSIKLGNFLYKHAFPIYNVIYPVFKKRQDVTELALIKEFVKPGNNVLDIGANIGFYTNVFLKAVGKKGVVFAFEPEPINFNYLRDNIKNQTNVILNSKAVSDVSGKLKIYLSKMLNVDHRTYPIDEYSEVKEIDAISIDDYLTQNGNPPIDFIKIDIQGFEMSAFKGMTNTLKNNHNIKAISELWPYGLKKAGSSATEMLQFLNGLGFNVYLLSARPFKILTNSNIHELLVDENVYYNVFFTRDKIPTTID